MRVAFLTALFPVLSEMPFLNQIVGLSSAATRSTSTPTARSRAVPSIPTSSGSVCRR